MLYEVITVIRGSKVWERVFGVPNSGREDGSPEVRKYMLQQANYLRRQLRLYARIDASLVQRFYAEVRLARQVSHRITSYNVCYTKLLRSSESGTAPDASDRSSTTDHRLPFAAAVYPAIR